MHRWLILTVVAALAGCSAEVLTTTAIQGELQKEQLQAVKRQVGYAGDSMAKTRLHEAIQTYQAEKGVFPPSLDALVPGYLPSVPLQSNGQPFGYDPATGRLTENAPTPVASGPSPQQQANEANLESIRNAIAAYGRDTGYYPPTLTALVPLYIDPLPTAPSGEQYAYNPQTGQVTAPGMSAQAPARSPYNAPKPQSSRPSQTLGGAGPLGETTTAIGIQNQLNSMNQSATSAAGSRARSSLGNSTQSYEQKQNKALDELGY